jgi:hypothetical protein
MLLCKIGDEKTSVKIATDVEEIDGFRVLVRKIIIK